MAKITYGTALGDYHEIAAFYGSQGEYIHTGKNGATWQDSIGGDLVEITGKNLKFESGVLVSGTVTKVEFTDLEHANYGTITGELDAKAFKALEFGYMEDVVERLSAGNDRIIGSANSDYIEGHKGNDVIKGGDGGDTIWAGRGDDRLFGGTGADFFMFSDIGKKHEGHDHIYDFDANGGGDQQDYISSETDPVSIHKDGKNVVIEFEDGATVTLIDVKRSDISDADFGFPNL